MKAGKSAFIHFFKRLGLFFIPFLLFILLYILLDPFCVIYRQSKPTSLHWNRDVNGSRLFLKNYSRHHYSSFILGNSKSIGFISREWGKYIGDSNVFHFDASSEDLSGIYSKLKYLDGIGNPLKNVLLVTDPAVYMGTNDEDLFGYNHDYRITGSSPLKFHFIFFKGFFTNFFFISYIDYCLFKTYRPYMKGTIPDSMAQYTYDTVTNDFTFKKRIQIIASDSLKFYSNKGVFYDRNKTSVIHWACIDEDDISLLKLIKAIFDKHNTRYKIVLSPVYNQEIFNKTDLSKLQEIFGKQNVFDFSGKNIYSENIGNYYDNTHFKPYIGSQLLKRMYSDSTLSTH